MQVNNFAKDHPRSCVKRGRLFHNLGERLDELIYNILLIILTLQVKNVQNTVYTLYFACLNAFKFEQCSSCELEF